MQTSQEQWSRSILLRTIETEIVPRLFLAHRIRVAKFEAAGKGLPRSPGPMDVNLFTDQLLHDDETACTSLRSAALQGELSLEQLCTELLTPAARRLGRFWETDECDFTEVTVALWRIQSLLMELSELLPAPPRASDEPPPSALLSTMPDSQHTFGLTMVAEYFRRSGWDVTHDPSLDLHLLLQVASAHRFQLIGLSASLDEQEAPVAAAIIALRKTSLNPDVGIMVGGPLFLRRPDLAIVVGADFTAPDAKTAVDLAERFVGRVGALR